MKLHTLSQLVRKCRSVLLAALSILSVSALPAANFFDNTISGINLGNASGGTTGGHLGWAIFSLSNGVTITNTTDDGSFDVVGNIGMAGATGLTVSASHINGSIYRNAAGQAVTLSGGASYTGSLFTNSPAGYVNTAASNATSASNTAKVLTATAGSPSTISLNNVAATYTAVANQVYVMNLTSLILSGAGAVLTLNGPSTANFVININEYMNLSNNAKIQLSGGLQANNVLFNVTSAKTYDVSLGGGATMSGIILAPNRKVTLTGAAVVTGEVIAKQVALSGRSKVINPVVSP